MTTHFSCGASNQLNQQNTVSNQDREIDEDLHRTFIPDWLKHYDFDDIDCSNKPLLNIAVIKIQEWVSNFKFSKIIQPLVIYGEPGTCKTMLAACAWNNIAPYVKHRMTVSNVNDAGTADNIYWVRGDKLPDLWMGRDRSDQRTQEEVVIHLHTALFAVLDDIDKCPNTETFISKLYGLIDARLCQNNVLTIITMNSTPLQLIKRYKESGGPIVDRFKRKNAMFVKLVKE